MYITKSVNFKVSTNGLINGSNDLYVIAVDNAGNSVNKTFDVYYVEYTPECELILVNPGTTEINDKEWILEKELTDICQSL